MFCRNCGTSNDTDKLHCTACGAKLESEAPPIITQNGTPFTNAAPQDTSPLSTSSYFWMQVLICVPIVGLIMCFIWAFASGQNVNRRNWARGMLIYCLVIFCLSVLTTFALIAIAGSIGLFRNFAEYFTY